jgi:osmoprotectant transport system permease protein
MQVASAQASIVVGSKRFTESNVLGRIAQQILADGGFDVSHRPDLGNTAIVWGALTKGGISLYPEYTGTITHEILKQPGLSDDQIPAALAPFHVRMSAQLGFNDAYGLVMKKAEAARRGISKISDLRGHPELRCGITHELIGRSDDGWTPLLARYGLTLPDTKAIDHDLGYAALASGQIDVKDCYTTDAEIKKDDLVVLDDDLHFFPLYRAVYLYRDDLPAKAVADLNKMGGTIREPLMIAMNLAANQDKDDARAVSVYFRSIGQNNVKIARTNRWLETAKLTGQHIRLVAISLLLAIVAGVPLGIVAAKPGILSQVILSTAGAIQTIPSLALLALLVSVPFFGIGIQTAIVALFLYSLLPIIRNTAAGLQGIPPGLRESAEALGLPSSVRLRKIYLPMALPTILAGIKTSAVINVGTATIAALIGAEGLGEPILQGLTVNDPKTILWGAIPAALLSLVVQFAFDGLEKVVVPRGLRLH